MVERRLLDDSELIGESDTREGVAMLECASATSLVVFVADDALEGDVQLMNVGKN